MVLPMSGNRERRDLMRALEIEEQFDRDGYVRIRLSETFLDAAETAIERLYLMQAAKCGFAAGSLKDALMACEPAHKREIFECIGFMQNAPACKELLNSVVPVALPLMRGDPAFVQTLGPTLFVNYTARTMYGWHSEAHHYPKRRDLVNFWAPIFGDRQGTNSMYIIPGGHKKEYTFQEFNMGPNSLSHYEIPDYELDLDKAIPLQAERGEAFLTHRNMPHKSNLPDDVDMAFALVGRIWNPQFDLTFGSVANVMPYNDDIRLHKIVMDGV